MLSPQFSLFLAILLIGTSASAQSESPVAPSEALTSPAEVPPAPAPAPAPDSAPPMIAVPVAPAPLTLPAPGTPGYVVPTQEELAHLDERIRSLQAQRPGIAGPITLLAVGGGSTLVFAYAAFVAWLVNTTENCYSTYDGTDCSKHYNHTAARTFGVLSIAGAITTIGGAVWLSRRIQERNEVKPELESLKARRRQLLSGLRYGFIYDGKQTGLSLRASF